MAGTSKNARGSRPDTTTRQLNPNLFRTLTPVGGGTGAYVFEPETGRNPRLAVASAEFTAAIAALTAAGHGAKIAAELEQLAVDFPGHNWEATTARLREAGAL